MSIFGNLGGMLSDLFARYGGPQAALSQVLNQMGGVPGVLDKLQKAGLGEQVNSWLGNGANKPITPEDIGSALGRSQIGELAAKIGVSPEQLSQMVAQALPGLIDRISPNGTAEPHLLPQEDAPPPTPAP